MPTTDRSIRRIRGTGEPMSYTADYLKAHADELDSWAASKEKRLAMLRKEAESLVVGIESARHNAKDAREAAERLA